MIKTLNKNNKLHHKLYTKLIDKITKKVYINGMKYVINFDEEKNQILKTARGIGFDEIVEAINKGYLLEKKKHFNKNKYYHQNILIINIDSYACLVPCLINKDKKEIYLKILYFSRKFTKIYKDKIGGKYD